MPSFTCTSTAHACIRVCIHMYTHVHTRTHVHPCACIHAHAHAWTCAQKSMLTSVHVQRRARRPSHRLTLCLLIKCCPPRIARTGVYYLFFANLKGTVWYAVFWYFGREITRHTVISGAFIHFWPSLRM